MKLTCRLFLILISLSVLTISCKKGGITGACTEEPTFEVVDCMGEVMSEDVNGFTVNYYPGGTDKQSEGNYIDGAPTGFWKFYHENGELAMEGNYIDGLADGFWKVFYGNGRLKQEGQYTGCTPTGFWKYYYETKENAVQFEGNFEAGEKNGIWKMYNIDGEIEKEYDCN